MTEEPRQEPVGQPDETPAEHRPHHPAGRPRAEADRELVPPDADFDHDSTEAPAGG